MLKELIKERVVVTNPKVLDGTTETELLEILKEPGGLGGPVAETIHWFYNVPMPGVRYYCYRSELPT